MTWVNFLRHRRRELSGPIIRANPPPLVPLLHCILAESPQIQRVMVDQSAGIFFRVRQFDGLVRVPTFDAEFSLLAPRPAKLNVDRSIHRRLGKPADGALPCQSFAQLKLGRPVCGSF
jgi:hypothetical protein